MSVRPSMRCAAPVDLLGRHVRGVPETTPSLAAARLRLVEGEAEVHQHRHAVGVRMMFAGLTSRWTMQPGVGVGQGVGHGRRDPGRLRPGRAVVPQPPAEVGAVEEIRDDVDLPLVHADVVDRHDAGVAQLGEPARLLEEPFGLGCGCPAAGAQHLDGHGPVELVSWPRYTAPKPPAPRRRRTW